MTIPTLPPTPSTIANLPAVGTVTSADYIPLSQNGVTYKATAGQFATIVATDTIVATAPITQSTSAGITTIALGSVPSGDIIVGNASGFGVAVSLSGDATISNAGALTFDTVNSNVGSFTYASLTVNGKGLVTAVSSGSVSGFFTVLGTQKFTTTGTYTPTSGMLYCIVEVIGGGGGSGGSGGTSSGGYAGGGGGAGGYSRSVFSAATIGTSQAVTIGAGGTAGAAANGAGGIGGTGGTSSLGSLLTALGGTGGYGANNITVYGGTGGAGTVNGVTTQGAIGGTGSAGGISFGGSTFLGGGGAPVPVGAGATVGAIGVANSGGGASGSSSGSSASQIGAVDGSGVVIITEFI